MNIIKTQTPESVEQLARLAFTDLHQAIVSHESGSIAGNVGSIHDMRVAVRRLRVALINFAVCLPKARRKRIRSGLENLADALGDVRDIDVMIGAMKAAHGARPDQEKAAVSELIKRLRARRRTRLRALRNYLSGEEYTAFKREAPSEWFLPEPQSDDVDIQPQTSEEPGVIEVEHGQAA